MLTYLAYLLGVAVTDSSMFPQYYTTQGICVTHSAHKHIHQLQFKARQGKCRTQNLWIVNQYLVRVCGKTANEMEALFTYHTISVFTSENRWNERNKELKNTVLYTIRLQHSHDAWNATQVWIYSNISPEPSYFR